MFKENSVRLKCSTVAHKEPTESPWALRWGRCFVSLGLFGLAFIGLGLALNTAQASSLHESPNPKVWSSRYARLPLSFESNHGQTDSRVKFLARGQNYTLFLTGHEAVLALNPGNSGRTGKQPASSAVVRFRLLGSASTVHVAGQDLLGGTSNYFVGNDPRQWHSRIPNYARVRYHQVYPGIDLVYYGNQGTLENDFVVSAGADPNSIRIGLEGVEKLRLDPSGNLVLNVNGGELQLRQPHAYQGNNPVPVKYVLRAGNEVGLRLGAYNHRHPLVIDPVLAYSTYFGGSGGDIGYGIAVDSSGNAYVTGISNSSNFPTSSGSPSGTYGGSGDVFILKLNPAGSTSTPQLVYSTYLGGNGTDSGNAIAVDAGGDAYVTGSTTSTNFTTTNGVFQAAYGGGGDAFVAELNSTGSGLVYSSYLGGSGADAGQGIAVDSSNNAYITGSTQSANFPTVTPLQALNAGSSDAFVAKVDFTGTKLLYSTYLGGSKADVGQSIKVDGSGNAYVAGYTFSTDYPVMRPVQGSNAGTVNAFVTELNPAGSAITFSTYLGGTGDDRAFGLALDATGNIYIAGGSQSTNFPTTVGVIQGANHGLSDAFAAKMNPAGPALVYSTLLGGGGVDQANGIAVDSSGDAFVTGFTNSSNFPTFSPIQAVLGITGGSSCGANACSDAFVSELNPAATALVESTYLGGSGADFGQAIALSTAGVPYVTGTTSSTNFPATAGAYQASLTGVAGNVFVAEIKPDNTPGISIVPQLVDFGNQTLNVRSAVNTVAVTNEGTAPLSITQISFTETDSGGSNDFAETDNCIGTVAASGGTCNINITFTPGSAAAKTGTFSITDNAAGSPHVIKVKGTGVTSATAVTVTPSSLSFGNVTVGSVSSAQTVTITNTGTTTLNITGITTTGDFSQTNTCGALLNVLNVGQSCTASVTFAPTVSGARAGALAISDNAAGSPQTAALSGTGVAQFTISSSSPNVTTLVGTTSATFTIAASAPSSFTGSITLSCPSSLTCSFNPANIFAGQTSTLTVNGLTASMANPFAFAVAGTSGSQSATANLNVLFADYNLSASPALNTIVAGAAATYTIALTPINGFNSQVQLACGNGMPPGATCTFSNASVTPSGAVSSVTLTIQTTKNASLPPPPVVPPGMVPPLMLFLFVSVLAGVFILDRNRNRFPALAGRRWVLVQISTLCLLILCETFLVSCRSTPTTTGSTTGNYIITVNGTLGSNSSIVRSTTVDLSVT
ncbi:MAG: choice-of-anchor D domain-containing protein [Acidobacteria bacterium]|nr:MAG: choice-of-anchor D domain-containing protein [Acidobacteriota bacterium]